MIDPEIERLAALMRRDEYDATKAFADAGDNGTLFAMRVVDERQLVTISDVLHVCTHHDDGQIYASGLWGGDALTPTYADITETVRDYYCNEPETT